MQTIIHRLSQDIRNKWYNITNNKLKKAGLNWLKIRRLKYSSLTKIKTYNLKNRKVYFRNGIELLHSLREIFVCEIYKMRSGDEHPYIIDCGANIGLSILFLKNQFPNSNILAFEPDEYNFKLLQKNTKELQNVTILKKAIWKENGFIDFHDSGSQSSHISPVTSLKANNVKRIETIRLKDLLIKPIEFLKIDIEGAEYEVLKDCSQELKMVKNIFIEYHGFFEQMSKLTEIFCLLTESGFNYYIKEAAEIYATPFFRVKRNNNYDIQINIFAFKPNYNT